jgi:CHAT domain-containing protein
MEGLVDRFISELRRGDPKSRETARDLYGALLQPVAEWQRARRVFIVPDGKLHLLPFDAVLNLNARQPATVSTVPSANVLFLLRTRSRPVGVDRPLLAVGGIPYDRMSAGKPPATDASRSNDVRGVYDASYPSNLAVLPSAEAEVLEAARLLGPSSVVLPRDQATEAGLRGQDLQSFGMLHFAAHAFAEPKFPERAAIVLMNDATGGDDGLLQAREIGLLRLNAGAVVLSACDTSVGPTLGQEGVLNIARAFLLAGAQSVVTMLWTVSDATSTALMRHFYENVAAGEDVAQALMRSKETVIERFGPAALPTVAAFQIVGGGDYRVTSKTTQRGTNAQATR